MNLTSVTFSRLSQLTCKAVVSHIVNFSISGYNRACSRGKDSARPHFGGVTRTRVSCRKAGLTGQYSAQPRLRENRRISGSPPGVPPPVSFPPDRITRPTRRGQLCRQKRVKWQIQHLASGTRGVVTSSPVEGSPYVWYCWLHRPA